MKSYLLASVICVSAAQAQVVECPKFYPQADTVFSEVPPHHTGTGMVMRQPLSGALLNVGEFNGGGDIEGLRKDAKNGYEVKFGIWDGRKWLVCFYGPNNSVRWWEPLNEGEVECTLKVVKKNAQGAMDAVLTCK